MSYDQNDPFGGDSNPAVSFDQKPFGTTIAGTIEELPKLVQSNDFYTKQPAFWPPNKDGTANPKLAVVTVLNIDGETKALWASKPSALFAALKGAQPQGGFKLGGRLAVTLTGDQPGKNAGRQKLYSVAYTAPDVFAEPAAQHNQQPYVAPTAANAGTLGDAAKPAGNDFNATATKARGLAAKGVEAADIAGLVGLDLATVHAILNSPQS